MGETPRSLQETIFTDALAMPPERRRDFVERACGEDGRLKDQVLGLLRGYEEHSGFLETAPASAEHAATAPTRPCSDHATGDQIGHYRLLEQIGEGGSAVVYMAEQCEPVRRRVALKLIKLGLDTREFIARFEAERQALALMDHPHIARVFDAGTTEKGRPYFVMELVRGVPITEYCDGNRLPVRARLELFVRVCQALQHAHQKGVIHRDIKPSNVLVADDSGEPAPKVIDFGIAKATQGRLTDKTLFTRFHAFIGTPAYSSPEQTDVTNLDVDTRSDIYSLGVLLYELLAGHPPVDAATIERMTFEELRHVIRDVEPPRPSVRVSALGAEDRTRIAQRRTVEPARLVLLLRSDLDWIVMRCLEKDRRRRYETAGALAQDVRRFLDGQPIEARPPSAAYRLRKFTGRHRAAVLAAGGIAAAVIAGLIVSSVLLVRERAARARAVEAELAETELRAQAEAGRVHEIKRSARSALSLSRQLIKEGRTADGLAYLVHAARRDPENTAIAARLASVLTSRNFLIPEHVPFVCGSRVLSLRFTNDGRFLLVGTEDGTLRVLDAATGALAREIRLGQEVKRNGWVFAEGNDRICAVRFVGDTLGVLDIAGGRLRFPALVLDPRILPGEGGDRAMMDTGSVRMSPDGRWVLAENHHQYWIWDTATGTPVAERTAPHYQICVFSPAGDRLAEVMGDALTVYTMPGYERIAGPAAIARQVARPRISYIVPLFSRDGSEVIVVDPWEAIHVFDVASGELKRRIAHAGLDNWIRPGLVQLLPNGRMIADRSLSTEVWDLETGTFQNLSFPGYAHVSAVSVDAEGARVLMTTVDGHARLVSTATGQLIAEESSLDETGDLVATLSPDGSQVAAGRSRGEVRWLRVGRGPARPLEMPAIAAGFTSSGVPQIRAVSTTETRVIDARSGRDVIASTPHPRTLSTDWSLPWLSPGARFLLVPGPVPRWEAWDFAGGSALRVVPLAGLSESHFYEFSPDGGYDVHWDSTHSTIGVRELATGGFVGPLVSYGREIVGVWNVRLGPGGRRLATGFSDGIVAVWDTSTGGLVTTLQTTSRASPSIIQFNPDGTRLTVSTVWGEAGVWDASTGRKVSPSLDVARSGALGAVGLGAVFSSDGRWLATVGERGLTLRDTTTFAPVREPIPTGRRLAGAMEFSRDGTRLVGGIEIWDVPSGEQIMDSTEETHLPGGILHPQFSADARYLLYQVNPPGGWVARIRAVPPRLAEGEAIPDWLLRLAEILAGRVVNEAEESVGDPSVFARMDALRRELAALPADGPYVEWGRWILDDRPERPIAPGFTITPAEAERLAGRSQPAPVAD